MKTEDIESKIFHNGFASGQKHTQPSEKTKILFEVLGQRLDDLDKKLDFVVLKLDCLLTKENAAIIYATKVDVERLRGRLNAYAWIVPFLTAIVGILAGKYL